MQNPGKNQKKRHKKGENHGKQFAGNSVRLAVFLPEHRPESKNAGLLANYKNIRKNTKEICLFILTELAVHCSIY